MLLVNVELNKRKRRSAASEYGLSEECDTVYHQFFGTFNVPARRYSKHGYHQKRQSGVQSTDAPLPPPTPSTSKPTAEQLNANTRNSYYDRIKHSFAILRLLYTVHIGGGGGRCVTQLP